MRQRQYKFPQTSCGGNSEFNSKAMAEISEAPPENPKKDSGHHLDQPDFDPETMRKTEPGWKRLILTISILFSFLIGLPFLLKSVEIYRSPLPFSNIDSLSAAIESNLVVFPCRFHAIFINFTTTTSSVDEIGVSIHSHMQKFSTETPLCGSCNFDNNSVSVTLDSLSNCGGDSYSWQCGALSEFKFDRDLKNYDEILDDYLESALRNNNIRKVYTVVVVHRDDMEGVRAVVGKYRHAWIEGRMMEEAEVVERIAEIFVKVFVNGGKDDGSVHSEFMPVGADGRVVLSFNLLNADPQGWVSDWDFQEIDEILLAPVVEALRPIADVTVESQVLYHTPKSSFSYWDDKHASYIFSTKDLPFFVNSNEWHLDTSTAAGGLSKVLHFVVYVPSPNECPLLLQLPSGDFSLTNGFISPVWGGVVVWNPPACFNDLKSKDPHRLKISLEELKKIFEVFMGQLRQLFGLKSDSLYYGVSGTSTLLASERGFTEWELDVLSRQHTCFNLLQCGTTLGSLSRLVQSLPRMIIMDEIGKQVKLSLEAAKLALTNASVGIYDMSSVSSRQSRSLAEDAFYHPSMMSVSYYSFEHCFAVYSPFFLPVSLHVVLAVLREWKRYKQEKKKYIAWKSIRGS